MSLATSSSPPGRLVGRGALRLIGFPDAYSKTDWVADGPLSVRRYHGALATPVGRIRGRGPAIITGAIHEADGRLIQESERRAGRGRTAGNPATIDPKAIPSRVLSGDWIYAGLAVPPFGHVLIEFLSRLWWVEDLGTLADQRLLCHPYREATEPEPPPLLAAILNRFRPTGRARYLEAPWVRGFLDLLGIEPRRIAFVPSVGARLEALTVASPVITVNGDAHPAFTRIYGRLAAQVCGNLRPDGRRIYLSRSGLASDKRRAVNETDLEALLAAAGFMIVHPQRMALAEQIKMMRHADVVVGCGGSAMHMLCFARPGTRALVLDVRAVNNQFAIEQVCGIRATHLWMGSDMPYRGLQEWTIDLDMVRRHLPLVLAPPA